MNLPSAPSVYDPVYQSNINREISLADYANQKKNQTVEVGVGRLVLQSPNGTRYEIKIDDSGNLSTSTVTV